MKTTRLTSLIVVLAAAGIAPGLMAAPVESVESARATSAIQKVDAFLGEATVVQQLSKLGVTPDQARARVAKLDDAHLQQLVAQIDLLKAGGTIQEGITKPNPFGCIFEQIGNFFYNIYQVIFCHGTLK